MREQGVFQGAYANLKKHQEEISEWLDAAHEYLKPWYAGEELLIGAVALAMKAAHEGEVDLTSRPKPDDKPAPVRRSRSRPANKAVLEMSEDAEIVEYRPLRRRRTR